MKNKTKAVSIILLMLNIITAAQNSSPNQDSLSFGYSFSGVNYFLSQSNSFFSDESNSWNETSIKLSGSLTYNKFKIEMGGIALKTFGNDAYGSGSNLAANPTKSVSLDPIFEFDLAYIQYNSGEELPLKVTIGRQPIIIGSQFLIGDGCYDGFHKDYSQVVYHNPRRNFNAIRFEYQTASTKFDLFGYKVHPTWDANGGNDGFVYGLDIKHNCEELKGEYAFGFFHRYSKSKLDNDMSTVNLRINQKFKETENLTFSGEAAYQFGTGRNLFYVTNFEQKLSELAWHSELLFEAKNLPLQPFIELGYVFYSKDFTPLATGFSDWGKWYLGNQIDWIIFGTNTKIVRAQAGCWLREDLKLRLQYHNTKLVDGTSGSLSDEFTLIGEWYPSDKFWVNVLFGYSIPGEALHVAGLTNPFEWINTGAVSVGNKKSLDVVLAFGIML